VAETDQPTTTSDDDDDDWMLLCYALALVTTYTNDEAAAKQLILDYYARRESKYAYRFQSVDRGSSRPGQGIDPGSWDVRAESRRYGIDIVVDWKSSAVTRTDVGPDLSDSPRPDLMREARRLVHEFAPTDPVIQIRLVRLRYRDILDALRWARLLPSSAKQVTVESATLGVPSPETESNATEPDTLIESDAPPSPAKKLTPQQEMMFAIFNRELTGDIPHPQRPTDWVAFVGTKWKAENDRRPTQKNYPLPHRNTVMTAVELWYDERNRNSKR
jgi:hypothetical protein